MAPSFGSCTTKPMNDHHAIYFLSCGDIINSIQSIIINADIVKFCRAGAKI
ncbi:hypothetical protein D3C75_528640 [compost metagenome]